MSGTWGEPWTHNPNTPQINYVLYLAEKSDFARAPISAILYGIVIILFVQCMAVLLSPNSRARGDIKWRLVVFAAVMFSLATIGAALGFTFRSVIFINGREFPGAQGGEIPPGPLGYSDILFPQAINIVCEITFQFNQWLADGFLLYRCYVIYAAKNRVITLPCLMYLASIALGIAEIYGISQSETVRTIRGIYVRNDLQISGGSVSLALNILLTLMIAVRLILHNRNIRGAGALAATSGVYKAIVTILVESFALNAVAVLLFTVLLATQNPAMFAFTTVVPGTQVIAQFLLILRVANRRALTSHDITSGSGSVGSVQFRTSGGESAAGDEATSNENPAGLTDAKIEALGGLSGGAENAIEEAARY